MKFFLIILLLITSIYLLNSEIKKGLIFDYSQIFNISFLLFYLAIPVILLLNPDILMGMQVPISGYMLEENIQNFEIVTIYIVIFYSIYRISYKYFNKYINIWGNGLRFEKHKYNKYISIAFLIISIASLALYAYSYGGFTTILTYSQAIRSGHLQSSSGLVFFKQFIKACWLSFFIFYIYKVERNNYFKGISYYYYFTLVISIIALIAYASRNWIIFFFLTPIVYKFLKTRSVNKNFIKLAVASIILIYVGIYIRDFLFLLAYPDRITNEITIHIRLINEFSGAFTSTLNSFSYINSSSPMFGNGFLATFKDLVPKAIYDFDIVYTVNRVNTEYAGYLTDERMYTINSGMLAYFIYEFGYVAFVVGPIITAFLISQLDRLFIISRINSVLFILNIHFSLKMFQIIRNGDPASIIKYELIMIIGFALLILINKYKIKF